MSKLDENIQIALDSIAKLEIDCANFSIQYSQYVNAELREELNDFYLALNEFPEDLCRICSNEDYEIFTEAYGVFFCEYHLLREKVLAIVNENKAKLGSQKRGEIYNGKVHGNGKEEDRITGSQVPIDQEGAE